MLTTTSCYMIGGCTDFVSTREHTDVTAENGVRLCYEALDGGVPGSEDKECCVTTAVKAVFDN